MSASLVLDGTGASTSEVVGRRTDSQLRWRPTQTESSTAASLSTPDVVKIKAVVGETLRWLVPVVARFNRLHRLKDNWDGQGAGSVSRAAIMSALTLLSKVMTPDTPPPAVVPTPEGGVQLEWHFHGVDLEVEVTPTAQVLGYFLDDEDESEWEATVTNDLRPVQMALSLIRRRQEII